MMLCLGKNILEKRSNYILNAFNSVGHACGHNIITVQGLACALALKTLMEKNLVQGTVVLFGTPAEETGSGKINFVKEGVLQKNVDYAMMVVSIRIKS
jgi:metal-dependent amidase/aminoacylase/carboxypeptidase family protein